MTEKEKEFLELFSELSWQERFTFLLQLGDELPEMTEEKRNTSTRIEPCTSRTFFQATNNNGKVSIAGWSNAGIPSGLIAMLWQVYDGASSEELKGIDTFIEETFLLGNLTEIRKNAFLEIINRIKTAL